MTIDLATLGVLLLLASVGSFLVGVNVQSARSGINWWRGFEAGSTSGYIKARQDALVLRKELN